MTTLNQIESHISSIAEPKRAEIFSLHSRMLQLFPAIKLWFEDGKNAENKTVANPTIGYGLRTIKYANGRSKDFFQIGISANTTGISVYILGIDKTFLSKTFADKIGKASVTGYCIKFKTLSDIDRNQLELAIQYGIKNANPNY